MTITKLEAVRRQLDAAMRLYFAKDDPIAVHTNASPELKRSPEHDCACLSKSLKNMVPGAGIEPARPFRDPGF